MSRLEGLVKKYCPDGVVFLEIGDICKTLIPKTKVKSNDYLDEGKYPVIDQGQEYIGGYTNEENVFQKDDYIIFGDHTCVVKYVDFAFAQGADGVKVLSAQKERILPKYLYYCMDGIRMDSSYARHWSKMRAQRIPVPPLEVQREIVRVLDDFTCLTAELTAELELRQQQFKAIASLLFEPIKNKANSFVVGDVCYIEKGKTPIQKAVPGAYPLVVTTSERKTSMDYQFDVSSVCVPLVSSRGHGVASLNHVYYQEGKFALGNILCALVPKDPKVLIAKYLYYYFEQTKDYTLVPLMKGGANVALRIDDIAKVKLPIPSIVEQQRVISILQILEGYCNSVLPSEIENRKTQYEYYRDRLLTFNING